MKRRLLIEVHSRECGAGVPVSDKHIRRVAAGAEKMIADERRKEKEEKKVQRALEEELRKKTKEANRKRENERQKRRLAKSHTKREDDDEGQYRDGEKKRKTVARKGSSQGARDSSSMDTLKKHAAGDKEEETPSEEEEEEKEEVEEDPPTRRRDMAADDLPLPQVPADEELEHPLAKAQRLKAQLDASRASSRILKAEVKKVEEREVKCDPRTPRQPSASSGTLAAAEDEVKREAPVVGGPQPLRTNADMQKSVEKSAAATDQAKSSPSPKPFTGFPCFADFVRPQQTTEEASDSSSAASSSSAEKKGRKCVKEEMAKNEDKGDQRTPRQLRASSGTSIAADKEGEKGKAKSDPGTPRQHGASSGTLDKAKDDVNRQRNPRQHSASSGTKPAADKEPKEMERKTDLRNPRQPGASSGTSATAKDDVNNQRNPRQHCGASSGTSAAAKKDDASGDRRRVIEQARPGERAPGDPTPKRKSMPSTTSAAVQAMRSSKLADAAEEVKQEPRTPRQPRASSGTLEVSRKDVRLEQNPRQQTASAGTDLQPTARPTPFSAGEVTKKFYGELMKDSHHDEYLLVPKEMVKKLIERWEPSGVEPQLRPPPPLLAPSESSVLDTTTSKARPTVPLISQRIQDRMERLLEDQQLRYEQQWNERRMLVAATGMPPLLQPVVSQAALRPKSSPLTSRPVVTLVPRKQVESTNRKDSMKEEAGHGYEEERTEEGKDKRKEEKECNQGEEGQAEEEEFGKGKSNSDKEDVPKGDRGGGEEEGRKEHKKLGRRARQQKVRREWVEGSRA